MDDSINKSNSKQNNSPTNSLPIGGMFQSRHIGLSEDDKKTMLNFLGFKDMEECMQSIVPDDIYEKSSLELESPLSEEAAIARLKRLAEKNYLYKSYIGQGYYNTHTPKVIQRNILENPGWYTSYTPYQPEISQGRLEALLNYQTMISDLTGLEIANASLLDEATAAAEAMAMAKRVSKSSGDRFFIDEDCFSQTIAVVETRAKSLGIGIDIGSIKEVDLNNNYFGLLTQYPGASGDIMDLSSHISKAKQHHTIVIMIADILALMLLKSPGELGADIAVGSTQRFGTPIGFGGPHAAYMATRKDFQRSIPGRIVGVSIDQHDNIAYRLALQTREQHIRREKATSNICTAQALLAIMAGFYAIFHGPEGLRQIAAKINRLTRIFAHGLSEMNYEILNQNFFDTVSVKTNQHTQTIIEKALEHRINLRAIDSKTIGVAIDETVDLEDIELLWEIFSHKQSKKINALSEEPTTSLPESLKRNSNVLQDPVFNCYHSETEFMRYARLLCDKDIALDKAMIPLGSCTMKLTATSEMLAIGWPKFSSIHPLAPENQIQGYRQLFDELQEMLCQITGFSAFSFEPNAGSQGEYAGLLVIDAYHKNRGETGRNICLIPKSAHGTNPASAMMAGMKVISINCDNEGNIDLDDLKSKAKLHQQELSAAMITYPSTHGVFETTIREVCAIVHEHGGQVYIDGANMNAMVGICYPGEFGGDVSHLNLHKTFCIPHGGGGPGVGPIGVLKHLEPFLPNLGINQEPSSGSNNIGSISAVPWGSASVLPISWMYITMMGRQGLRAATESAILSANYIASRLKQYYKILYTGHSGLVAHECIIDLREFKQRADIEVDDVAKRLIDHGFHPPTISFPVPGTLMIEPTESESKKELDRFCDAMISIRDEITAIESGELDQSDNPLKNAPHTAEHVAANDWHHVYSRESAAYPLSYLKKQKYWPPVGRLNHLYGEKNLRTSRLPEDE